ERVKRAVLVVRRREIAQPRVGFAGDALGQCRGQSRLADAGLAGDQHDPALAGLGLPPAAQEQIEFLVAAGERRRPRAQCLEAADDAAFADHLPGARRLGKAGERQQPEIFDLEQTAELAPRDVAMTTRLGALMVWSRAARFGVSPTTPRSCAAPSPIRSPTT